MQKADLLSAVDLDALERLRQKAKAHGDVAEMGFHDSDTAAYVEVLLRDGPALIQRLREAEAETQDWIAGNVTLLKRIAQLERVRAVAQQISDNEIRYKSHPVPAAAIGWNDARAILRAALAAVDEPRITENATMPKAGK